MQDNDPEIRIQEIHSDDPRYGYVERLMSASFPEAERRDADAQHRVVDNDERMHCCVIEAAGTPVGLLTYWQLDGFVYIEHFAIDPGMRNSGYGRRALLQFIDRVCGSEGAAQPLLLEVEQPDTPPARRRIGFYERCGLVLWPEVGYIQPSYRPSGMTVPMRLMTTPSLGPDSYDHVRRNLYTYVYRTPTTVSE